MNKFEFRLFSSASKYKMIATNIPTVYTCDAMDPDLGLDDWKSKSNYLFSLTPSFVTPEQFKYKLPEQGF